MFWAVERDTRGASLDESQRFNYYPATPLPSISWIFQGSLQMVADPYAGVAPELGPVLSRVVFAGPHRHPSASWSTGDVHALTVSFLPESLNRLFGIRMESFMDKVLPLESLVSDPLIDELLAIEPYPAGEALQPIERLLLPHWTASGGHDLVPTIQGWISSVAQRAAFTDVGVGIRQIQRQLKRIAGQSQRDLQIYARTERAMMCLAGLPEEASVELADLAVEAGFSDQSHMGREIRRVSGLSPGRLDALMRTDEAFWFYRLVREGFQEHCNQSITSSIHAH